MLGQLEVQYVLYGTISSSRTLLGQYDKQHKDPLGRCGFAMRGWDPERLRGPPTIRKLNNPVFPVPVAIVAMSSTIQELDTFLCIDNRVVRLENRLTLRQNLAY